MALPRFDSLSGWLSWMEGLHPSEIDLGLDRVTEVANNLGLLNPSATVVTVAGTNGKGSCVQALSTLLQKHGCSVGAYTSPHIIDYNERIGLNNVFASDAEICAAFAEIDAARGDVSLTYFEFGTLAAFYIFNQHQLDYWILEVGLGGRLDAVNILDAQLAILTSVDLDHEAWLGSDRERIGREKVGILRNKHAFVCAEDDPPLSVLRHAKMLECDSYFIGREFTLDEIDRGLQLTLRYREGEKPLTLSLSTYHLPPASLAAAAQAFLLLTESSPDAGVLLGSNLPGRYERLSYKGFDCILDVAHNPHAAKLLAHRLECEFDHAIPAIFACMSDKNISGIVEPLLSHVSEWYCSGLANCARSERASNLKQILTVRCASAVAFDDVGSAIAELTRRNYQGPLLIFGTFYLISEFKKLAASNL